MTQANLDRAVARATGETVTEIRRLGFSLLIPPSPACHREGSGVPPSQRRQHRGRRAIPTPKPVYAM